MPFGHNITPMAVRLSKKCCSLSADVASAAGLPLSSPPTTPSNDEKPNPRPSCSLIGLSLIKQLSFCKPHGARDGRTDPAAPPFTTFTEAGERSQQCNKTIFQKVSNNNFNVGNSHFAPAHSHRLRRRSLFSRQIRNSRG